MKGNSLHGDSAAAYGVSRVQENARQEIVVEMGRERGHYREHARYGVATISRLLQIIGLFVEYWSLL